MGILGMLGGLSGVGDLIKDVREAITGKKIVDPEKQAEINLKLAQLEQAIQQGQIQINEAEAKSSSTFVAGARPFILWICGLALGYNFILNPLIQWFVAFEGLHVTAPVINTGSLYPLMMSLLGLGGLRSWEKLKGVSQIH